MEGAQLSVAFGARKQKVVILVKHINETEKQRYRRQKTNETQKKESRRKRSWYMSRESTIK